MTHNDANTQSTNFSTEERLAVERALAMARRVLRILEAQAAGFGNAYIPSHLQIAIDEKRQQISEFENRIGNTEE